MFDPTPPRSRRANDEMHLARDEVDRQLEEVALRLRSTERHLRPGGTISGPTIFTLADLAFYQLTLSLIGPVPLAVTTQLNLSFMRRPDPGLLEATATMLKLGRRLAVGDVLIEGEEGPVAHAQVTYSIPPPEKR